MALIRYSAAFKDGLVFVWIMTFCSEARNHRKRSLGLGPFHFLGVVVKALSGPLGAATVVQ